MVDDDNQICRFVKKVGSISGYACTDVMSAAQFSQILERDWDIIVLDLIMPETDGVELLRRLAAAKSRARIILMSGLERKVLESAFRLAEALGLKIVGFLTEAVPGGRTHRPAGQADPAPEHGKEGGVRLSAPGDFRRAGPE